MYFSRSLFLSLLATPFLVLAQNPNPFNISSSGLSATAGQPLQLAWTPTTQGTVSLILRSGASNNLEAGTTIASSIANSGSYTWNVPSSTVRGSDYTIEIVDDADSSQTNYTPYFVIDSTVTVATSSASTVSQGAPTSSLTLSTAKATSTGSSSSGSSSSGTSSGTSTGSASSSTGSSTASASSSSAASSSRAATTSAAPASTPSSNSASSHFNAAAGMLGAIALGALAL